MAADMLVLRARHWWHSQVNPIARSQFGHEYRVGLASDPGPGQVIRGGIDWLCLAQDRSTSNDGGIARHYSVMDDWSASYPETTGYIVPTFLEYGERFDVDPCIERARRMLDWLVSIQFEQGGFPGGVVGAEPSVPVTFNTGQILLGLAAGAKRWPRYLDSMRRAGDWLVESMDEDGCWRRHPTPFAEAGEKVYETHVAWGLFEAGRVASDRGYTEAGLRNVAWALSHQHPNGWFAHCCLTDPVRPLTHTLGYALRGVIEGYRASGDARLLTAARRTADGLLSALRDDGMLPGRLASDWSPAVDWACLTGSVQVAHCWLLLYQATGEERYLDAGCRANAYVRRTVRLDGPEEVRGAVKGSHPIWGAYGAYEFLNWAAKFSIDSNMLELSIRQEGTE